MKIQETAIQNLNWSRNLVACHRRQIKECRGMQKSQEMAGKAASGYIKQKRHPSELERRFVGLSVLRQGAQSILIINHLLIFTYTFTYRLT